MQPKLSTLVRFVGKDRRLVAQAKESVVWLADTKEGKGLLDKAFALHRKPLTVHLNAQRHLGGYVDSIRTRHTVFFNPAQLKRATLHGSQGQAFPMSQERFLAHEFTHAGQRGVYLNAAQCDEHQHVLWEQSVEECCAPYRKRLLALRGNDSKLRQLLGEMYDTQWERINSCWRAKVEKDPDIAAFYKTFEVPAIRMENKIMGRYGDEPPRGLDYVASASFEPSHRLTKQRFVDGLMAEFRQIEAEGLLPNAGRKARSALR